MRAFGSKVPNDLLLRCDISHLISFETAGRQSLLFSLERVPPRIRQLTLLAEAVSLVGEWVGCCCVGDRRSRLGFATENYQELRITTGLTSLLAVDFPVSCQRGGKLSI
jgi:hypothetical protein